MENQSCHIGTAKPTLANLLQVFQVKKVSSLIYSSLNLSKNIMTIIFIVTLHLDQKSIFHHVHQIRRGRNFWSRGRKKVTSTSLYFIESRNNHATSASWQHVSFANNPWGIQRPVVWVIDLALHRERLIKNYDYLRI